MDIKEIVVIVMNRMEETLYNKFGYNKQQNYQLMAHRSEVVTVVAELIVSRVSPVLHSFRAHTTPF
jgi:hypothetical protein